jgi:hypothetical protein
MIVVFLGFVATPDVSVKQIGLGPRWRDIVMADGAQR